MADRLSVVANSFAAVGLADIMLRAGNQIYQFLIAIKDAPVEVENLKNSIHENIILVQYFKDYLEELKQLLSSPNPSTIMSLSKILPLFESVLKDLGDELSRLNDETKCYKRQSKILGNIRFVFDEQRIEKSLQRLEGLKLNLIAMLIFLTRLVN